MYSNILEQALHFVYVSDELVMLIIFYNLFITDLQDKYNKLYSRNTQSGTILGITNK